MKETEGKKVDFELQPCPFCGGQVVLEDFTERVYGFYGYKIKCKCGLSYNSPPTGYSEITKQGVHTIRNEQTKKKALYAMVTAWNTIVEKINANRRKATPQEHHHTAIKEVDGKGVYFRFSICPSCLFEIISYKNDDPPNYCTHCGQAIEWNGEN